MVSCVRGYAGAGTAVTVHLPFCAVLSSLVTCAILLQGWWAPLVCIPLVVHPSSSTKSHPGCQEMQLAESGRTKGVKAGSVASVKP